MNEVTKKEFLLFPNRYLNLNEFILTNHGRPQYKVLIETLNESTRRSTKEVTVQAQA